MGGINLRVTESGDYEIDTDHKAVGKILVEISKLPPEKRLGVARSLLAASATYCFAGYLNYMLKARGVMVNSLTASSFIEMGKNDSGADVVERLDIDVFVDVPEEKRDVLERCCRLAEEGCLITQSLLRGVEINHQIKY
jgi:organic hydroperoxide reductase OsmC/OhrA